MKKIKTHGGARKGSGAKKKPESEKKEKTKVMRIPNSKVDEVKNIIMKKHTDRAMKWWNSLTFGDKFYKTIAANSVIEGDKTRHPNTLTEDEIERVFEYSICFSS